jgi:hypothetical protein
MDLLRFRSAKNDGAYVWTTPTRQYRGLDPASYEVLKLGLRKFTYFFAAHARASAAVDPPSFSAIWCSFLTFASFALPSSLSSSLIEFANQPLFFAKRESSGIPLSYLPVRIPEARGLQMVVPYWNFSYRGAYSASNRSRWNALYCGCSAIGAMRLYFSAMSMASWICFADHSEVPHYDTISLRYCSHVETERSYVVGKI